MKMCVCTHTHTCMHMNFIYMHIYDEILKPDEILPFVSRLLMVSKISQRKKIYDLAYM